MQAQQAEHAKEKISNKRSHKYYISMNNNVKKETRKLCKCPTSICLALNIPLTSHVTLSLLDR